MKKEPLGLYILRILIAAGLFVFMLMLYWSSTLVEDRLESLKIEMAGIKNEIFSLREEYGKIQVRPLTSPSEGSSKAESKQNPHIDPSLPNLLTEDPFYAETLPKLLGADFIPSGTFQNATVVKPDDLHPFTNWAEVSGWRGMCGVSAAQSQFGKFETFAPNMAVKVEARMRKDVPVPEYWVFLRDDVFWQPLSERMFEGKVTLAPQFLKKHRVTAHDYKFYFDAAMNPFLQKPGAVALRNYIGDIEKIEVVDDQTFIVRWRAHDVADENGKVVPRIRYIAKQWTGSLQPLPGFVYKYFADGSKIIEEDSDPETYRTNSVWAQNFSEHWAKNVIVSCGPWKFEGKTDREIRFSRNSDHFFPLDALAGGYVFGFKNTPDTIWQEFKSNQIDTYSLRPDQLIELDTFLGSDLYREQEKKGEGIKRLDYNSRTYLYIGWNMAKPYFKSRAVRQAMTMAIDRDRIIKQYLNGMGVELTGPFSPFSSSYDKSISPWPFDPQMAKRLLEEEGWYDSDGDGIVDKIIGGKKVPFVFRVTYYVKNPTTKSIVEYVATALREIGVQCELNGVDTADLSAAFDDKSFDAICLGWMLGSPPEDPRQLWYSSGAKEPGSSNAVGFVNKEADAIIDKLDFEDDPEARIMLYHRFHQIIHEEQPYTFLYTPKTVLLYREYIKNVFIPADRQDLIPGADVPEPSSSIFYIQKTKG